MQAPLAIPKLCHINKILSWDPIYVLTEEVLVSSTWAREATTALVITSSTMLWGAVSDPACMSIRYKYIFSFQWNKNNVTPPQIAQIEKRTETQTTEMRKTPHIKNDQKKDYEPNNQLLNDHQHSTHKQNLPGPTHPNFSKPHFGDWCLWK